MNKKYNINNILNLPEIQNKIAQRWGDNSIFKKSVDSKKNNKEFVFYEGPPSANGLPGIHHVLGRAVKDIFCRYKSMQGFKVERKAGWDTHGLPVELGVEKELGIKKVDIGSKISIEAYNQACKSAVMRYTDKWSKLTSSMGYWVDMETPYVTYDTKYIESVWYLIKELYKKEYIYKGYTIQPYSPMAGTGLSSHELNQQGCYKDVKDTTVVAQFKINSEFIHSTEECFLLAWTTTPWTLPSNTALCIGENISYCLVKTFNQYTKIAVNVILAKDLVLTQFPSGKFTLVDSKGDLNYNEKRIPYFIEKEFKGKDLIGIEYQQLLDYVKPYKNPERAFRVIAGDFVTTTDGTGIVHIAPTFGVDDSRVANQENIPPMLVLDEKNEPVPLVNLQGKFVSQMKDIAGMYVKNEYYSEGKQPEKSVDVLIAIKLKEANRAFRVEKYEHSYPHCWRTDKPILYYPLDSWFIKTTEVKNRMIQLNKTINWLPKSTGEGRFGNWLENLNDWNLSRSRFWGIPIPIWVSEDGLEIKCIGSLQELKEECNLAVKDGNMNENPFKSFDSEDMSDDNYTRFDLHKHIVDNIVLSSSSGKPMKRESDLLDVWFDSGAMPYAQIHYPFENKSLIDQNIKYPADFIAEGIDQTRGWFFTLHAISTLLFDKVAFKNVISNGLLLDKNGQKMSKRLGNVVDPFKVISEYGADAVRWYMATNTQPWDNLKFDVEGVKEVQRKYFNTLHNTYNFFALYANIDGFNYSEKDVPFSERDELDQWILSKLNSLISQVKINYDNYDSTAAARKINAFTNEDLSNWYVRLSRRRFWKGEYNKDKISAYQTIYQCLRTVALLSAPIIPFYSDYLFSELEIIRDPNNLLESVHLALFPKAKEEYIDIALEQKMSYAQRISSLTLSLRKQEGIKVRQPLSFIIIPVNSEKEKEIIKSIELLIKSEVNIKEVQYLDKDNNVLVKKMTPNYKVLGPKFGKSMKQIANIISLLSQKEIKLAEKEGAFQLNIEGKPIVLNSADYEITTLNIPGCIVASERSITVALNTEITLDLEYEGIAREIINKIQIYRKEQHFEIFDKIQISCYGNSKVGTSISNFADYICSETLALKIDFSRTKLENESIMIDLGNQDFVSLKIDKI